VLQVNLDADRSSAGGRLRSLLLVPPGEPAIDVENQAASLVRSPSQAHFGPASDARIALGRPYAAELGASTSTRGSHSSQVGRYQFRWPRIFIAAGRSTERMIVASIRSAAAIPKPIC
jgi:hypothetical protein